MYFRHLVWNVTKWFLVATNFSRTIPLWSVGFPVIRFLSIKSTMWHCIGHGNRETNVYQPSSSSNSDWSLCWFGILYKWHTSHNLQINFKDTWVLYYHLNTTITSSRDHYLANAFIFCNVHRSLSVIKFSLDVCTQFESHVQKLPQLN